MKLTENKLKQLIVEVMNEAKLNPTFWLDYEKRNSLVDRVMADPEVDHRIKAMLKRALDNPTEDWAIGDINQVDQLLRALYPKYAEELEHYDSKQGGMEYEQEFVDFYRDAKERLVNEVRVAPDHRYFATDDQIVKIHSLLDSGNPESIEMAKSILDALGASPSYFDDYMRNQEVGEVEKLANKHGVNANSMGLDGDANLDALGEYFTELDKFEKREVGRGRAHPDPAKEFYDRYQGVADTYGTVHEEDEE